MKEEGGREKEGGGPKQEGLALVRGVASRGCAVGTSMGGCVGSHHDSSGSLNENSDGTGGRGPEAAGRGLVQHGGSAAFSCFVAVDRGPPRRLYARGGAFPSLPAARPPPFSRADAAPGALPGPPARNDVPVRRSSELRGFGGPRAAAGRLCSPEAACLEELTGLAEAALRSSYLAD